jgi:ribonuclease E
VQANPAVDANASAAVDSTSSNPADTNRTERPSRNAERNNRGERGERSERRPTRNQAPGNANAPSQDAVESTPLTNEATLAGNDQATASPQDEDAPREKRSRDRYGRERKPRGERTESAAPQTEPTADEPSQDESVPRKSYFAQPTRPADATHQHADFADTAPVAFSQDPVEPSVAVATPVPETIPVAAAPATTVVELASRPTAETGASSTPAPVIAATAGMPQVEAYVLPMDQLAGIAQQSGLTWVNSDAEKIAAVQATIAAEPKPVHVPRERPPVVTLDNRPLVLVETRLDLRDIKLPFEETQSA